MVPASPSPPSSPSVNNNTTGPAAKKRALLELLHDTTSQLLELGHEDHMTTKAQMGSPGRKHRRLE